MERSASAAGCRLPTAFSGLGEVGKTPPLRSPSGCDARPPRRIGRYPSRGPWWQGAVGSPAWCPPRTPDPTPVAAYLLASPEERERLGRSAREQMAGEFNWDTLAVRAEAAYARG